MKIHLTVDQPPMGGYLWGCPQNKELKNPNEFYNCWEYCMEGQCTELYAPSIMDIFRTSELEKIIPRWAKLIAPSGKILLGGVDLYILSREAIRRSKDLGQINDILFDKSYGIQSITSAGSTREFLQSQGFSVSNVLIDYDNFAYTVEGIKNAG